MKYLDRQKIAEYGLLVLFAGVVLFICINTAEAKKLLGYVLVILRPFIYGFCIAFILNMLTKQFDKLFAAIDKKRGKEYSSKKHRVLTIILALIVLLAFLGLTVGLIIPNLSNTVNGLTKQAPQLWEKLLAAIDGFKLKQPKLAKYVTMAENGIDNYVEKLMTTIKSNLSNIASTAISKIKSASNVLVNFLLGIIIGFAILVKKEELKKELHAILKKVLTPTTYRRTSYVLDQANQKFQIYLKYNVIQALITGAGTFVTMLITGMPYKVSITLLITVTQLIPIVGAIVGSAVGAILIAAESPIKGIIFVVLCILVQQIVEKLINPHLIGKELDMPGVITFLAIILGGKQFGLIGLICAVPVVSLVYDIYRMKIRPRIYDKK